MSISSRTGDTGIDKRPSRCTVCCTIPTLPRFVRVANGSQDLVCSEACADIARTR